MNDLPGCPGSGAAERAGLPAEGARKAMDALEHQARVDALSERGPDLDPEPLRKDGQPLTVERYSLSGMTRRTSRWCM